MNSTQGDPPIINTKLFIQLLILFKGFGVFLTIKTDKCGNVYIIYLRKRIRATPWNIYFDIADIVILIYRLIITTIRNQK